MFDCETCEFRQRIDGLDADNERAWRTYAHIMSHRWLWEMQAGAWWVTQVLDALDDDERDDILTRVDVIYDTLRPPQEKPRGA